MTPKTTTQNLMLWGAAFGLAVLLSALSGIATHWPEGGSVDWRGVTLDVIQTILTTAPLVAAGFGLPRLGKESIAALVSDIGKDRAQDALEVTAATGQVRPGAQVPTARELALEMEKILRERAEHGSLANG